MFRTRTASRLTVGCLMSVGYASVGSAGVEAQGRMPAAHFGLVVQETPHTSELGWVVGVSLPMALSRRITFSPSVDLLGTHVYGTLLTCAPVAPTNQCLTRPDGETVAYLNAVVRIHPLLSTRIRPFVEGGVALGQSFNTSAVGARPSFLAPQAGAGVVFQTAVGSWSINGRWRRLDRWSPTIDAGAQVMLFVGYRPN